MNSAYEIFLSAAGADPGFEIRGGANGKFQEKQGGGGWNSNTIIIIYIFQKP